MAIQVLSREEFERKYNVKVDPVYDTVVVETDDNTGEIITVVFMRTR